MIYDLKEFLEKKKTYYHNLDGETDFEFEEAIMIKDLGLFFWERGGKQHVKFWKEAKGCEFKFEFLISRAEYDYECDIGNPKNSCWSLDFLDCVACLGEDKVKELIKKEVKEQ